MVLRDFVLFQLFSRPFDRIVRRTGWNEDLGTVGVAPTTARFNMWAERTVLDALLPFL